MLATGATAVRGAVLFLGQPARPWTRSSLSKAFQSPELRPGTKAPLWWSCCSGTQGVPQGPAFRPTTPRWFQES